eukprot:CAMPEP_0172695402 /NCGR_PEP_ID=MMETSP1074-20121228/27335_1 /TAXON_ID=2916 /ORGANISM="Ceratium fusus, Strain PA161109" /LENGTH=182 /DNA_ID=CAMNT_0013516025 /DNA_START=135 /DNA_END=684 /DNA_ORIENTATION=-
MTGSGQGGLEKARLFQTAVSPLSPPLLWLESGSQTARCTCGQPAAACCGPPTALQTVCESRCCTTDRGRRLTAVRLDRIMEVLIEAKQLACSLDIPKSGEDAMPEVCHRAVKLVDLHVFLRFCVAHNIENLGPTRWKDASVQAFRLKRPWTETMGMWTMVPRTACLVVRGAAHGKQPALLQT